MYNVMYYKCINFYTNLNKYSYKSFILNCIFYV